MALKNLVLAAGKSKPELSVLVPPGKNKVLLRILGKPVLYYPLTSLQRANRAETVLVYRKGEEEVYREASKYSIEPLTPAVQEAGESVADAVLSAEKQLRDKDYFFLLYGDIILEEEAIRQLMITHLEEEPEASILIVPYDPEYAETYGVAYIDDYGYVKKIVSGKEARETRGQAYIVGGAYILPTTILDKLRQKTLPEILNELAEKNKVKTVLWNKLWIDIGYPTDLLEATYQLLENIKYSKISSKAEIETSAIIRGKVIIEDHVYIDHYTVIKGPIYIGENSFIGAHSLIRQYTDIENNVRIGSYNEVKKTNIQPYTLTDTRALITDSIIGENSIIGAKTITLNVLPEHEEPPRLRTHIVQYPTKIIKKLGAIIGYNTVIGPSIILSPGKIIKQNTKLKPKNII